MIVKNIKGLSAENARDLLDRYGPNRFDGVRPARIMVELLSLFANPLAVILLTASTISFVVGNHLDGAIIAAMVLLSVALNFFQTWRSRVTMETLTKRVAVSATVLRDGSWQSIDRDQVVPGDVLSLSSGDLIPADASIIECRECFVQEAALTGESLPVRKTIRSDESEIFVGTSVISGSATAVVIATGMRTRFGEISRQLTAKPPETEFERGTRKFGFLIARLVFVLVIFVFFVNALAHRDALESLLFSIALGVGLTPEFLPVIMTVTLGQGARRMAKHKVIVKHLEAIQNFGSIDILCSDKTGTLTSGELSLRACVDYVGVDSELPARLGYLNSCFQSGIQQPIDKAIMSQNKPDTIELPILGTVEMSKLEQIDQIPFDFERRIVSVVISANEHCLLIAKGAPESILARCSSVFTDGDSQALGPALSARFVSTFRRYSESGVRAIAVAFRAVDQKNEYDKSDESEMVLAGILTFADEPLPSAAESLTQLANDGIQVKILTGDNELVARHVCDLVGLDSPRILLGEEIDQISDAALEHAATEVNIFARVTPIQKNRILLALKRRGHVVGFLGDGINDAPSLHSADVGISVSTATDVAKDAAEIVLLEPGLDVLHTGIIEGRKSFGNVMKYLLMGTSSNFGNMFSMAGAVLFLPFLPMLPTQILLNNFLYDLAQITIPTDNVDAAFIRKPHRWDTTSIRNFMLALGPVSSIYDFLTFGILLSLFNATESLFQTGWFVESLATQTLVVFVIRTAGNPFHSRPSLALTLSVTAIVIAGLLMPFMPGASALRFVPLPASYYLFLVIAVTTYLFIVDLIKRRFFPRLFT